MAPNPESDESKDAAASTSDGAPTKDHHVRRRCAKRSRELVPVCPPGRLVVMPTTNMQTVLTNVQLSLAQRPNQISGDAVRAAVQPALRMNELVATGVAAQLKQLTDTVTKLPVPQIPPMLPVSLQVADRPVGALESVRNAMQAQQRFMVPTTLSSTALVGRQHQGALGLAAAADLARSTRGLNEALFRSVSGVTEALRHQLTDITGPFRLQPGWDLSTRVRIDIEAARVAAVRGETEGVEAFADRWLDLPRGRREARMLALADALIWLDVEDLDSDTAWGTLRELERDVRQNVRNRKLLGETQLLGRSVYYLEDMNSAWGEDEASGQCPRTPSAETAVVGDLDDFDAMRVGMVLARLDPSEQKIVMAKGQADGNRTRGVSWVKAAREVGATEKEGRRVRDKAVRIGRQINKKLQALALRGGALQ